MKVTQKVKKILANYESDNPGTKANLARILMTGKLAGTGKLVILPVDQGFEHGPARSFAPNPDAYDPHYHYQLAIDAGCRVAGATVHQVTTELDVGPILAQGVVPVLPGDTADTLAARVLVQEHEIYPRAVLQLLRSLP